MTKKPEWRPCDGLNDTDACHLEQINAQLTAKKALDRSAAEIEETPRGTRGEKPSGWKRR
jgi:hypothetical protein